MGKVSKELTEMFKPDDVQTQGINDLLQVVLDLRESVDRINQALKADKEALNESERSLIVAMNEAGLKNFKNDDGVSVIRRAVSYFNVLAADRPELFEWLRIKGAGDLIKETVHPGTLKVFCSEYMEQGNWLPEFVKVHEDEALTIRGRK